MDYQNKYLKYKTKYLTLKAQQTGGGWEDAEEYGKTVPTVLDLTGWKINQYTVEYKKDTLTFNIIKYSFDEPGDDAEYKPVLFAMAGVSSRSFSNSAKVIVDNIEKLRKKFSSVYMINYDPLKDYQNTACGTYKKLKEEEKSMLRKDLSSEELGIIYKDEIDLNIEIASIMNKIITEDLKLKNVHLLGKCNGGFVCLELVSMSDIYNALYLAVPGSPIHIQPLTKLSTERLENIDFMFGWNDNDDYKFNFTPESRMEKDVYDSEMEKLRKLKKLSHLSYKSYMFPDGNGHEINVELIKRLSKY